MEHDSQFSCIPLSLLAGANFNPAPENTRNNNAAAADYSPPRESIDPNMVFGNTQTHSLYPQLPPYQPPLDYPRLPDNRQPFPASPNQHHNYPQNPYYHDNLTPPPNVFGPFRNSYVTTTKEPSLLDQFLYNKSPKKNGSTLNRPSAVLTMCSLIFLLIYRLRKDLF